MPRDPHDRGLLKDAADEIKGMGKQGLAHPSSKPVIIAGTAGALAGAILPFISWPVGLVAGAGFMLHKRLRP